MNMFLLAARIAARELRGGLSGFRVFVASLALGVAAVAGVGSMSLSVTAGLQKEGRALLGGDVSLDQRHVPASAEQIAYLQGTAEHLSQVAEMRAMASAAKGGPRTLIEMKAVDRAYPLAGTMVLRPAMTVADAVAVRNGVPGAAVDRVLLGKLGVGIGEKARIGDATVEIRAVVEREPDRVASVLAFGPRFLVSRATLDQTGLVQPGSQIRYRYRVALPNGVSPPAWRDALANAFPEASWRVRGTDDAAPGLSRFINRLTLFLSFVGLTALLVGGVGVTNATQAYMAAKTTTIATLKCMGAPASVVFIAYFLQILVLAAFSIVIGLSIGGGVPFLGSGLLATLLPVPPVAALYPEPLLLAAAFGFLVTITFALWPLARARRIPAAALFRDRIATAAPTLSRADLAMGGLGVLALGGLALATASDKVFAAWFIGGAALTLVLLRLGAALLMRAARTAKRPRNAGVRLALANLYRPDTPTPGVVLSLGIGLSVLVGVALVQENMATQVDEELPDAAPAFFFIDIQTHQVDGFSKAVLSVPETSDLQHMPSLRGRIIAIDGTPVEDMTIPPGAQWAIQGDRALTYAAKPAAHTKLVAGEWWPKDYAGPPAISFDAGLARAFGVGVGDTLTLNVLGRDITATIQSLRDINWRSLRFDFAIIFAPGPLEGAPHTHIAAVQAPEAREAAVEQALADAFPNISAIRVREALEAASAILAGVGDAVRGTASIALLAGALVLGGAVAAGGERRIRDAVVFKVLGATRQQILRAFLIEYGILGAATGLAAAGIGTLIGWAVVTFLLRMDWTFFPATVVTAIGGALAVTLVAGFAGTWHALGRKAAPYLRNE